MAPLEDILVVSIDQAVAAPYAASRLADAGARVIKIERPGGDFARHYDSVAGGESAFFVWLNRGKESVELDLRQEEDAALLERMLARADVFIQNLAPGALTRLGFDTAELRARYPRLITCDISGYGNSGPYRDMKAYDMLVQAETGLCDITGSPEQPGRVGVSICDLATGKNALIGIQQALLNRERTGKGSGVQVSLFDSLADWMTVPLLHYEAGRPPGRTGLDHPILSPYGRYPTSDGELVIAVQSDREWCQLCENVLEQPDLGTHEDFKTNERRVENRQRVDKIIVDVFSQLSREVLAKKLLDGGIAFGALNTLADLATHPQLRRVSQPVSDNLVNMITPPVRFAGESPSMKPIPKLGEHTAAIREEFR